MSTSALKFAARLLLVMGFLGVTVGFIGCRHSGVGDDTTDVTRVVTAQKSCVLMLLGLITLAIGFYVHQNVHKLAYLKRWLQKESTQGQPDAKLLLTALTYNLDRSDRLIMSELQYALQGDPLYQCRLGLRFLHGDGVAQNTKFAKEMLGKSAGNGNETAKNALSRLPP